MKKRRIRKWNVKALAALLLMVFAINAVGVKAQAEEDLYSDVAKADMIVTIPAIGSDSAVSPLTTMFNCEIIMAFTSEGLEMEFTTSCVDIASVIGVKDIKVQQKVWYGWKTVFTSAGAENKNENLFAVATTYPDAENGKTYRVTCVHYANSDVYEEVENDTGSFKFIY